ncbi:MAG: xanthine dehydrogenase small subunit, partial [Proteobacteria bacterium]|nr:xanthine dehydrogenase small subunit [Pseudomonadota bacterium]
MPIRFILNGEPCEESAVSPSMTVLDYLRERRGLTGTKEGCAEGDCGACTIVTASARDGGLDYEAANACLMLVPQLDGKEIITVEGLAEQDGTPHAIQQALVAEHGSQCGFCTPGIVMALFAFHHSGDPVETEKIHDALAGNLCRCTGYRPIVDAALTLDYPPADRFARESGKRMTSIQGLALSDSYEFDQENFHAPPSLEELVRLRAAYPDAYLLGGGTDLGILASKDRKRLGRVIWTAQVPEMARIERTETHITIGAAVTYTAALPLFEEFYPSFANLIRRIGSRQIRNLGTLGGNVCNASPIGDTPPIFLVLEAVFIARSRRGVREIPAEAFFVDYRKTALAEDENLEAIRIPLPHPDTIYKAHKISKRFDQDISAVIGVFALTIRNGTVEKARVAFGGMAATPARAVKCEATLGGAPWNA